MSLHIPLKASNLGHHSAIIIASTGTVLRVNQPGPEGVLSTRVARVPIKPRRGRMRSAPGDQGIGGREHLQWDIGCSLPPINYGTSDGLNMGKYGYNIFHI